MTSSEAGLLFSLFALCLFSYGLTISGFIIDKWGVKKATMLGLVLYAISKFILIFAETKLQLYIIFLTIGPLGVSILFPVLTLGVKRLTLETARPQGFSLFYASMVVGFIFAGPLVDFIRHDYKMSSVTYHH